MNDATTLPSGAVLELQMADFKSANRLRKAVLRELQGVKVDLDLGSLDLSADIETLAGTNLNTIKNLICQVAGSDAIETEFFACAARCLYNNAKITEQTFEDPKSREDFIPVAMEVIKFTLRPFFKGLDLSSLTGKRPKVQTDSPL